MFHLPDIPNVGYSTARERFGSDAIMVHMRAVERDRLLLLTIVTEGRDKWREQARKSFGYSLAIPDEILDEIYWYFFLQASRPLTQIAMIQARKRPDITQRIMATVMPHLERERQNLIALASAM